MQVGIADIGNHYVGDVRIAEVGIEHEAEEAAKDLKYFYRRRTSILSRACQEIA